MRRPVLGLLAAAVLAAYPAAGLYPYRWAPPVQVPNSAEASTERGLRFVAPGPGIARSEAAPDWVGEAKATNRIEIELRLRTDSRDQYGPARIVSLSEGHYRRNFTLGQEGSDLVFRLRTPQSDANGRPATWVPGVFATPGWRELRIVVEPGRLEIEVDGKSAARAALPERPLRTWNRSFRLALGNELTNKRTWLGEISHATVRTGGQVIDYAEPGRLEVPPTLWLFDLTPRPVPLRGLEPIDAVVNLAGFVPLGIVLGVWLRPRRRFARGLAVIVLTSVTIEALQLFVPGRTPASDDLLLNSLGGAIGLLMSGAAARRLGIPRA